MKKEKEYICNYASEVAKKHWDKINFNECKIPYEDNKNFFVGKLKNDYDFASWFVTEVMVWGMDKNRLTEIKVQDNNNGFVGKFGEKYIKFTLDNFDWVVNFVKPKTKEVIYFD